MSLRIPGSSPHTRGLPSPSVNVTDRPGIIPAHAGFTPWRRASCAAGSDHPRTRGVYVHSKLKVAHTRGLRPNPQSSSLAGRIIPAHAGFTLGCVCGCLEWADHPRTRGVYRNQADLLHRPSGSSPHTRGLRSRSWLVTSGNGIIPAHAGFTSRTYPVSPDTRDHPRTRGVY